MKYKVVFLPEARADADEIMHYLSQYYQSTVISFFALLKKQISSLKSNHYIAQSYSEWPSYRRMLVADYLVFYKVDNASKMIEIHRILNGSRDIGRYIS